MEDFTRQLTAFEPFFSSVAQVSGALLGLVFVALTFNPKTMGMRHDPAMRGLAQQVFADFLMVLVVSLILLIPGDSAAMTGLPLVFIGVIGLVRILRGTLVLLRAQHALRAQMLHRFGLSLLGNIGLLASGILLVRHAQTLDTWTALVGSCLLMLISGARSAWLLVMQNAE